VPEWTPKSIAAPQHQHLLPSILVLDLAILQTTHPSNSISVTLYHTVKERKMATKTTLQEFESVFPKLEEDLLSWAKQYNLPEQYLEWYKKVRCTLSPSKSMIHTKWSTNADYL
jgi:hypothetical protein